MKRLEWLAYTQVKEDYERMIEIEKEIEKKEKEIQMLDVEYREKEEYVNETCKAYDFHVSVIKSPGSGSVLVRKKYQTKIREVALEYRIDEKRLEEAFNLATSYGCSWSNEDVLYSLAKVQKHVTNDVTFDSELIHITAKSLVNISKHYTYEEVLSTFDGYRLRDVQEALDNRVEDKDKIVFLAIANTPVY